MVSVWRLQLVHLVFAERTLSFSSAHPKSHPNIHRHVECLSKEQKVAGNDEFSHFYCAVSILIPSIAVAVDQA